LKRTHLDTVKDLKRHDTAQSPLKPKPPLP